MLDLKGKAKIVICLRILTHFKLISYQKSYTAGLTNLHLTFKHSTQLCVLNRPPNWYNANIKFAMINVTYLLHISYNQYISMFRCSWSNVCKLFSGWLCYKDSHDYPTSIIHTWYLTGGILLLLLRDHPRRFYVNTNIIIEIWNVILY